MDLIKTNNKFLEYDDYLKIYAKLNDEEKKNIITSYKDLIYKSLVASGKPINLATLRFWKDFFFYFF